LQSTFQGLRRPRNGQQIEQEKKGREGRKGEKTREPKGLRESLKAARLKIKRFRQAAFRQLGSSRMLESQSARF
jgi:hypothetical protein